MAQMAQSLMNNPMMQQLMSNPDIMRGVIESNPQARAAPGICLVCLFMRGQARWQFLTLLRIAPCTRRLLLHLASWRCMSIVCQSR